MSPPIAATRGTRRARASRDYDVSVHRHRGQHVAVGTRARTDAACARAPRRDRPRRSGEPSRRGREDQRRWHPRGVRRPSRRCSRRPRTAAGACRSRRDRGRHPARALRIACRRGRASRQRLLRKRGQSRGTHHARGARRASVGLAGGCRADRRTVAHRGRAARSGDDPTARSRSPRACLPGLAPESAPGLPCVALARSDAQQPAAAGDFVHRARARGCRSEGIARDDAALDAARRGRSRKDASFAAGRRRCHGRLSGRRVVRGVGGDRERAHGCAGSRNDPRCQGGSRASGVGGRDEGGQGPTTIAGSRQLRASRSPPVPTSPSQLLQASPHLNILASSREPLHVSGETNYPIPALAVPDVAPDHRPRSADAVRSGAAVHRAGDRSAAGLSRHRQECPGRGRNLSTPGRYPIGDRARRGAPACPFAGKDR